MASNKPGRGSIERISRRELLRTSILATGISAASTSVIADALTTPQSMLQPGTAFTPYGAPAPSQSDVTRILPPPSAYPLAGSSRTPLERLEGTITPNGLHFERHHNGVPDIDPEHHDLIIHGLLRRPLKFSRATLLRYPMESHLRFIECGGNSGANSRPEPPQMSAGAIHGLVSQAEWTGVRLALLLEEAGIDPSAAWIIAEGADGSAMTRSVPLKKCLEDAMIALFQNGEALRPEQGFPMRLLLPGFEGNMQVKWLHRLKLTSSPAQTRFETATYTDLLPDGRAQQFVFETRVKSVILKPSFGMTPLQPGQHEISGIAWSHGEVARLEISTDSGKNWQPASLDGAGKAHALRRFRLPWHWDGAPCVLMSRATNDAGDVQPFHSTLVSSRAAGQRYHFNAIQSWAIDAAGVISNVYV